MIDEREMTITLMSPELRDDFDRNGFIKLEGALPHETVERLTEGVDRVYAEHEAKGNLAENDNLHLFSFVPMEPEFLELLMYPPTFGWVVDILSWNIHLFHAHLDVHPPIKEEPKPVFRWHQDGSRQNAEIESHPRPRFSVKIAYFLTDVSEDDRGNFCVIPGSHLSNKLHKPDDPLKDPAGSIPILAKAGDAVMFDRRIWHKRSENRSTITRKALFTAYTYRWIHLRDEFSWTQQWWDNLDPVQQQLMGRAPSEIGRWLPTDDDVPLRVWLRERGLIEGAAPDVSAARKVDNLTRGSR